MQHRRYLTIFLVDNKYFGLSNNIGTLVSLRNAFSSSLFIHLIQSNIIKILQIIDLWEYKQKSFRNNCSKRFVNYSSTLGQLFIVIFYQ